MNEIEKDEIVARDENGEAVLVEHELHITAGTVARTIILVIAIVNQILTYLGKPILPIANEQIAELVANIWTIVISLISWWKNNSFTSAALAGDVIMRALKLGKAETEDDAD